MSLNRDQTQLRDAIKSLDVTRVEQLLVDGLDVNASISYETLSHIHLTTEQEIKRLKIVERLFEKGMDPLLAFQACVYSDRVLFDRYMAQWLETIDEDDLDENIPFLLSRLGGLAGDYPVDSNIIEVLIEVFWDSGYQKLHHYEVVFANAIYYANPSVVRAFQNMGLQCKDHLLSKVCEYYRLYHEQGNRAYERRYLEILCMVTDKKIRAIYRAVLSMIERHDFELSYGGVKVEGCKQPISKGAAFVYTELKRELTNKRLGDSCLKLIDSIEQKLGKTRNGWMQGLGSRTTSTTGLYARILSILNKAMQYVGMTKIDDESVCNEQLLTDILKK
jgi:hypothetical protein